MLQHRDKYFTNSINSRKEVVSLDQLKPAYLDAADDADHSHPAVALSSPPSQVTPQPLSVVTRSGRHIHFPNILDL